MFAWELETESPDSLDDNNLELIADFTDEAGYLFTHFYILSLHIFFKLLKANLFHEAIHRRLGSSFEQSCNSQSGDRPISVSDQALQVKVAGGDSSRVSHGHLD
jgi:hypothetical protein